jgi:hypothetical protein
MMETPIIGTINIELAETHQGRVARIAGIRRR